MRDAGNFDAMIGVASHEATPPKGLAEAVQGLAKFHSFTGLASVASLRAAAASLGKVGDVLGEANCIKSLGDIALYRSDYDGARERYEAALPLYRKVDNVLGEANCIQSLGDIALDRSDHDGARERYEAALPLYRKVGAMQGEANCIRRLGDIALARSDHDGARERYEAALPLYRKVGAMQGEANCILSLGDIDEANKDIASARRRWSEALALYGRIAEPYSIGLAHLRLARRAATPAEAAAHREAARRAWASIDRPDLIAKFLDKAPWPRPRQRPRRLKRKTFSR
jgi:tetratricopeptide (TPR) repeat protein